MKTVIVEQMLAKLITRHPVFLRSESTCYSSCVVCMCIFKYFIDVPCLSQGQGHAIPIQTPYHIKNKLTHSLIRLTRSTAAIPLYSSCHINNSWYKITNFIVIPSRAECNILTYQWHSSSKIYTIRHNKTNQFWAMTQTSCNKVKETLTQLVKSWHATRQASNNITMCVIWQVPKAKD